MGSSTAKSCYNQQLPDSKEPGFTSIYRKKGVDKLLEFSDPQVKTMQDVLKNTKKKYNSRKGIGQVIVESEADETGKIIQKRTIKTHSYKEFFDTAYHLGKAIFKRMLYFQEPLHNMKLIGIYAKNRYEWFVTDWACVHFGFTSVPLYDTLGVENLSFCLNQTQMTTLFVSAATINELLNLKNIGKLQTLISYDKINQETQIKIQKLGLTLLYYSDLIEEGLKLVDVNNNHVITKSDDCFTFSYTSGTTGPPKGVMVSHKNLLSFFGSITTHQDIKIFDDDVYISYLPLPHLLQRSISIAVIFLGVFLVISSGDIIKFKEDCAIIKPTFLVSVPRIYTRIVNSIKQKLKQFHGVKKYVVDTAFSTKLDAAKNNGDFLNKFYDPIIFSKFKAQFGGKLRIMASGSAPISIQVHQFMKAIMSCPLIEAYGTTQSSAAILYTRAYDKDYGMFSEIGSACEIKLCDIPQMNYTSQDRDSEGKSTPRGQIWVRGPQVCLGYYKMEEQTHDAITKDGWLRTGDVGQIQTETMSFKLIDRKKNIFKLQQGQYIAPQKVENKYLQSNCIDQIFVHGESTQNFAVAIAHPNKDFVLKLATQKKIEGTYEELCLNIQIKKLILTELNSIGKKTGLYGFEMAKNIFLDSEKFYVKNLYTNTMKFMRFEAKKYYKSQINKMYEQGEILGSK